MPYPSDGFFRTLLNARANRIGSYIDVGAGSIFVREPAQVARRERGLQFDDSLKGRPGNFTPQKQSDGLTRSERTSKEVGCSGGWILSPSTVTA